MSLHDVLDEAKQAVTDLYQGFREQNEFAQRRAYVVAGWVGVALVSLVVIPPAAEHNPLGARVSVGAINFGSRVKTYVEVINEGSAEWRTAQVTIQGTYNRRDGDKKQVSGAWSMSERWRRGEKRALFPEVFKDRDGYSPEMDVKVRKVVVKVKEDTYEKVLDPAGGS
jgi:hypothetical protein